MNTDQCQHCDKTIMALHGSVQTEIEGKQVLLCVPCWNKYIAEYVGSHFETLELKPITLKDCLGIAHVFHFFTHLNPPVLSVEAREIANQKQIGYQFSVVGPQNCNQADLILDLYEKIKKGLSKKYLAKSDTGIGIKDFKVVGRIEWDDNYAGEIPKLVIDGRPVTWDEFGKMLMTCEGWQFKLEILDPTDECF